MAVELRLGEIRAGQLQDLVGLAQLAHLTLQILDALLLWKVLTAKRWELLKALCGAGPVSIREAARRVNRDVKAVHSDVTALLHAGVLDRAEGGGIVFPYEAVKVEFLLQAA
jgi:predicted transcriptional regulator